MQQNKIDTPKESQGKLLTQSDIEGWLASHLAGILEINPYEMDVNMTFDSYGLDSEAKIVITGDLQNFLGCDLEPTLLFEYETIADLAEHCSSLLKK